MTDTIDLPDDVMIQAAQDFFSSEWADAREESGFSFSPGTEITKVCPKQDHATLLGLIRPYVIRLAQAWGRGVGAMFSFMEITEDEWAVVGWSPVGDVPYAVFMEVRVFDSWVHEQDARRALDRPGGSGNRASALSLDRVQGAMPFVVGKQAGCAEGTAVRFDVSGPGVDARAFTIAVEGGRARPAGDEVDPAVTLSLSSIDFARLGCGRATAAQVEAAGGVALAGDAAVGRRVLGAMNFMF
ncbi:MAG: SCP2 sterol-binding domain-containing protein [Isosphaeraceae bacterium]